MRLLPFACRTLSRRTLVLLAAASALLPLAPRPAAAQAQPVVVTTVHGRPAAPPTRPPPPTIDSAVLGLDIWVDQLDLRGLDLTFDSADGVAAGLRGSHVGGDGYALRGALAGGIAYRPQLRPVRWLSVFPIGIYLGGGSVTSPWVTPRGATQGFDLRLDGLFAFRLDTGLGLRQELGPLALFATGRFAFAAYVLSAHTRHETIGDLGDETLSSVSWELGYDAGVALRLDGMEVSLAFRQTFTGAPSIGAMLGIAWRFAPPPNQQAQ